MGKLGALQGVKDTASTQAKGVHEYKTTTPLNTGKETPPIFDKTPTQSLEGDHCEEKASQLKVDTITKVIHVPSDTNTIFITKDPSK